MDLEKIYSEGKGVSHAAGLKAVFDAGVVEGKKNVPDAPPPVVPEPAKKKGTK
jgi:hypothetical protein